MNRYSYMMSPEYCKNWTIKEAIREVLANALDTAKIPVNPWVKKLAELKPEWFGKKLLAMFKAV